MITDTSHITFNEFSTWNPGNDFFHVVTPMRKSLNPEAVDIAISQLTGTSVAPLTHAEYKSQLGYTKLPSVHSYELVSKL
jgi:hypothetical protein